MKKVLFVCDGNHYSHEAFELIKQIGHYEPLFVKGIFFSTIEISALMYAGYPPAGDKDLLDAEKNMPPQVVERFVNQCKTNDIPYLVKEKTAASWNKGFWKKETRFADLLVISQKMLCSDLDAEQPNTYMLELLRWADCPVWATPERKNRIGQIIGAYDGSPACMHALTSFCKAFPQFCNLPARFVYIKHEDSNKIPDLDLLEEYIHVHFKEAEIQKLHWEQRQHFTTWVAAHKNAIILTGSFGRSAISNFLQESFAAQLVREQTAMVFMAR